MGSDLRGPVAAEEFGGAGVAGARLGVQGLDAAPERGGGGEADEERGELDGVAAPVPEEGREDGSHASVPAWRVARASVQRGEARAVGDEEEAGAGGGDEVEEEGDDGVAGGLVEVAGGLVGEDEAGAGRKGAADGDALLLAAGELFGVAGEEGGEAEAVGELGLPGGVEAVGEAGLEGEVGGDVEAGDEVELLEDEADGAAAERGAGGVGQGGDIGAGDLDAACSPRRRGRRRGGGASILPLPDSPVRARLRPGASVRETASSTARGPWAVG